jgi:hypothetical protein
MANEVILRLELLDEILVAYQHLDPAYTFSRAGT